MIRIASRRCRQSTVASYIGPTDAGFQKTLRVAAGECTRASRPSCHGFDLAARQCWSHQPTPARCAFSLGEYRRRLRTRIQSRSRPISANLSRICVGGRESSPILRRCCADLSRRFRRLSVRGRTDPPHADRALEECPVASGTYSSLTPLSSTPSTAVKQPQQSWVLRWKVSGMSSHTHH